MGEVRPTASTNIGIAAPGPSLARIPEHLLGVYGEDLLGTRLCNLGTLEKPPNLEALNRGSASLDKDDGLRTTWGDLDIKYLWLQLLSHYP